MASPYQEPPRAIFLSKISTPLAGIGVILFFCVGIAANSPSIVPTKGPKTITPFWETAFLTYSQVIEGYQQMPKVCLYGEAISDFQQKKCESYWSDLSIKSILALAPVGVLLVIILIALDSLNGMYRTARRKIKKNKASFVGQVTDPPEAASDVFSWYYCFQGITIQTADQKQMTVYIPLDVPTPLPGQRLAAFDVGNSFGEKRHLAVLYAPHMTIIRGT